MNNCAISIVMPVFNAEKYLKESLDSVIEQDFDNYEIICIDDGSTDCSLEILQNYANLYKKLTVISQKNLGATLARKTGIDVAHGKYILFADADDIVIKDALKNLYVSAYKNNADIIIGNYIEWFFYINKEKLINLGLNEKSNFNVIDLLGINSNLWNKLIKRSLLENISHEPLRIGNDLAVLYQAAIFANTIVFTSNPVYKYRIHHQSITYSTNIDVILDIRLTLDTVIGMAKKNSVFDKNVVEWSDWKLKHCVFQLNKLPSLSINEGLVVQREIKKYVDADLLSVKDGKTLQRYNRLSSKLFFITPLYWMKKSKTMAYILNSLKNYLVPMLSNHLKINNN